MTGQLTDAHLDWAAKFTGKDPRQAPPPPAADPNGGGPPNGAAPGAQPAQVPQPNGTGNGADTGTTTATATKLNADTSGVSGTRTTTTREGDQFNSNVATVGVAVTPGNVGVTAGSTKTTGTVTGAPGEEKLVSGTETKRTGGVGVVSDDKGVGVGGTASQERKTVSEGGKSLTTTVAAGGRCQALVAEVPNSDPPSFTITTTISFNVKLGATAGKESEGEGDGASGKASAGISASLAASASFKHILPAPEAEGYLAIIRAEGRGGKLPEHKLLATGASEGWPAAQALWATMSGGAAQARALKPGEEVETDTAVTGGAKLGAEGSKGGATAGASVEVSDKHHINLKKTGLPDGRVQITATIEDEAQGSVSGSVGVGVASMQAGASKSKGESRVVQFVLDPKDPAFDAQLKAIEAAKTSADLDKVAAQNRNLVGSSTTGHSSGEGETVGAKVGPVELALGGQGKSTQEETRDAQGNVIGTKSTGENTGGGTIGIGPVKVGDTTTDRFTGTTDNQGHTANTQAETNTGTDIGKSVRNLENIAKDPLGTLAHPDKLLAQSSETKALDFGDPELQRICNEALNPQAWNWKVVGIRHDDWVATGKKVRAALTVKDGEITAVNKGAVQQAMAEWNKGTDGGRTEAVDSILRPLGGVPTGKASFWPDGTEKTKAEWDALVAADPLAGARTKLGAGQTADAVKDMQAVRARIRSLSSVVQSQSSLWQGHETEQAEMLGHITARTNEIDKAIRDAAKQIQAAQKAQEPAAPATPDQAKEEENRALTEEIKADLETYNNNLAQMKVWSEAVFKKLGDAEAKIKDDGVFSGSTGSRIQEAIPWINEAQQQIKLWTALYWPSYGLYEKISKYAGLDKARLEKLHPAGAQGRYDQVYKLTTF